MMWRIMQIAPSEICIILHIMRKPNSIIVLLLIQNISRALKTQNVFLKKGSHSGEELSQNQPEMKKYLNE